MDVSQKLDFNSSFMFENDEIYSCSSNASLGRDSGIGCDNTLLDLSAHDSNVLHSPRKCDFTNSSPEFIDTANTSSPMNAGLYSPPYKRVKALRLFDSPASPFTIVEKNFILHNSLPRSRLFAPPERQSSLLNPASKPSDKPSANLNPFTPNGLLLAGKKRSRSKRSLIGSPTRLIPFPKLNDSMNDSLLDSNEDKLSDHSDDEVEQPTKKMALHDANITRYSQEFHEISLIGTGEFGSVFKCINRLDGCKYAVKRSIKPVTGSINEKMAMNEVYAHAVLGKHPNVVRYYSAWAEEDHMIIQNEYCNGGSLADLIQRNEVDKKQLSVKEMRHLLLHVAEGLRYIHSIKLVHMDIKPGNIFITRERRVENCNSESADDCYEEDDLSQEETVVVYKIGDLGHVTSLCDPKVEEGDCRYLPNEILQEDYTHLTKADIFALGITMYEAGGGGPIPKNGPEWHDIRNGKLKNMPHYSRDFNHLLKLMVDSNPDLRPSAAGLIQHRVLCPFGNKTKAQLRRELNAERLKTEILTKKLEEAAKCLQQLPPNMLQLNNNNNNRPCTRASRLVGKKVNRSHSNSDF